MSACDAAGGIAFAVIVATAIACYTAYEIARLFSKERDSKHPRQ